MWRMSKRNEKTNKKGCEHFYVNNSVFSNIKQLIKASQEKLLTLSMEKKRHKSMSDREVLETFTAKWNILHMKSTDQNDKEE
jgi:hypothetical protein